LDEGYEDAAARLAQAREAQAREEAEQQRQAALAERYENACARMDADDWPEAVRLLGELQEEEPGYRDVEARLAQATSEQEKEERLEQLYAEAEDAYDRAAWKRAGTLYGQVLALEPGYREAEAKKAEALRQQQLARQYSQAWSHLKARRWQEAIDGFTALVEAEPDYGHPVYGSASDLLAQARQGKEREELPAPPMGEQRRPAAGQRKPSGLPEEIKRHEKPAAGPEEEKAELPAALPTRRYRPGELPEAAAPRKKSPSQADGELERRLEQRYIAGLSGLEQRYVSGLSALWLRKWDEACGHFQAIVDESPGYKDAAEKLVEAQRQKRWSDLFEQAQSARKTDNWNALFAALEELVAENPEYRDAAELLVKARQEREQAEAPVPQPDKPPEPAAQPKPASARPKPTGGRPKPAGLPEEVKRRDKPNDLPS
jgi:outer membrane protein assembly factor BamD (BamD/ComL family)